MEGPKDKNEEKDIAINWKSCIEFLGFSEISRVIQSAFVEYIKFCPDSFGVSLFDTKPETKILRGKTNSTPESYYGVKQK